MLCSHKLTGLKQAYYDTICYLPMTVASPVRTYNFVVGTRDDRTAKDLERRAQKKQEAHTIALFTFVASVSATQV